MNMIIYTIVKFIPAALLLAFAYVTHRNTEEMRSEYEAKRRQRRVDELGRALSLCGWDGPSPARLVSDGFLMSWPKLYAPRIGK